LGCNREWQQDRMFSSEKSRLGRDRDYLVMAQPIDNQ
jgi:hypothetical protein